MGLGLMMTRCARAVISSMAQKIITGILQKSIKVTKNGCWLSVVGETASMHKFEDEPRSSFLVISLSKQYRGENIENV